MRTRAAVAVLLAALTFALFSPVRNHAFLSYDDGGYVVNNPLVVDGVSVEAMGRAFTTPHLGNWIPLSYISLQIDRSLWGSDAGKTLLVNAGLHALSTALLFLAFAAMTGEVFAAAFVAAVFGLHPLHVESVAWASERKDVLSGVFWMLSLLAWSHYARSPGPLRYAAVVLTVGLGLLAKPMLVTLPLVLLLLDYWPLGRLRREGDSPWPDPAKLRRALLEKLPLLALAAVSAWVTLESQTRDAAVFPSHVLTWDLRVLDALVSYGRYLLDAVWPHSLAAFYPHPVGEVSRVAAAASAGALALISTLALRFLRERPWLLVGWLWYLGTLVPVVGLLQVGMQARADRYTYLPLIGASLMLAFSGAELARRGQARVVAGVALLACVGMAYGTSQQIPHWRSSEALFRRALAVTPENWPAQQALGFALLEQGEPAPAVTHFEEALRLNPGAARARVGLANALVEAGRRGESVAHYEQALAHDPDDAVARGNLGIVLVEEGRLAEAEPHLERALALHARFGSEPSRTRRALGAVRAAQGRAEESLAHYEAALVVLRDDLNLRAQAGAQAQAAGRPERAVAHYREVLRREPRFLGVANNLAWLLASCAEADVRAPDEALRVVEAAIASGGAADAALLDTQAAAYAAAGRLEAAVRAATGAYAAALREDRPGLAEDVRGHRRLFESGEALHIPCRSDG